MTWMDFVAFMSLPLVAIVAWLGRQCQITHKRITNVKDEFLIYKTEVAQTYVSIVYLKDVETRILKQLTRIEDKLDKSVNGVRK